MRYVVPISHPDEVEPLADSGADELYCGVLEPWWMRRYGDHDSVSRRQGKANLSSRDNLALLATQAKEHDLPVYLTVNGRYTERQLGYLVDLCQDFEAMGGTGLQIFDWGLMSALREMGTSLQFCLSILAVAANTPTLAFYCDRFAISRVVFPRFVTPAQTAELLAPFPQLEGEVMVAGDRCPFIDGYCRFYHGNAYSDAELTTYQKSTDEAFAINTYDTTYVTHSCRSLLGDPPNEFPCAACRMEAFETAGVQFAKIGGRGTPLAYRLSLLRFLQEAKSLEADTRRQELYHQTFGSACNCYDDFLYEGIHRG
jgi:collagenase-like PrtC family protease